MPLADKSASNADQRSDPRESTTRTRPRDEPGTTDPTSLNFDSDLNAPWCHFTPRCRIPLKFPQFLHPFGVVLICQQVVYSNLRDLHMDLL